MIGNLILFYKEVVKVLAIEEERVSHWLYSGSFPDEYVYKEEDEYNPVPLTPKILEMCGFVVVHKEERAGVVALFGDYRKGDFVLNSGSKEWWYWSAPLNTKIEYLHQLQNLFFALTGEELQVQDLTEIPVSA